MQDLSFNFEQDLRSMMGLRVAIGTKEAGPRTTKSDLYLVLLTDYPGHPTNSPAQPQIWHSPSAAAPEATMSPDSSAIKRSLTDRPSGRGV